eukprot:329183_1
MNTIRLKTSQSWILNASFKSCDSSITEKTIHSPTRMSLNNVKQMIVNPVIPQYHQSKAQINQFQTKLDDIKRRMETMRSCNFKMEHTTACELYNVYRNRYYKSLEGRQCKSCRCNW